MKPNIPIKVWRTLKEFAEKQEESARQRQAWEAYKRAKDAHQEAYSPVSRREK